MVAAAESKLEADEEARAAGRRGGGGGGGARGGGGAARRDAEAAALQRAEVRLELDIEQRELRLHAGAATRAAGRRHLAPAAAPAASLRPPKERGGEAAADAAVMVEVRLERSAGGALGLDVLYRPELSIYPVVASAVGAEAAGLRGRRVLSVDGTPLVAGGRLGALPRRPTRVRSHGPPRWPAPAAAPPPRKPPPPPRKPPPPRGESAVSAAAAAAATRWWWWRWCGRAGGVGLQVDYPPGEHPRVSDVSGAAAAAGVRVGDGVLAVDDVDVAIAAKLGPYLPAAGAFTLILRRPRGGSGAGSSDDGTRREATRAARARAGSGSAATTTTTVCRLRDGCGSLGCRCVCT